MNVRHLLRLSIVIASLNIPITAIGQSREEVGLWQTVQNSTNPDDLLAYLDKYPDGTFATLARRRLAAMADAKNATASRLALGESQIVKLLGWWTTERLPYFADVEQQWQIASLRASKNSTDGANVEIEVKTYKRGPRKQAEEICTSQFHVELNPDAATTIAARFAPSYRLHCNWYKKNEWATPRLNGVLKELTISEQQVHLLFFNNYTTTNGASGSWNYNLTFSKKLF